MKRMAMILISIMVFCSLAAPPANMLMVFESEGMNPYENLYRAVCQVESSGNPLAIGDKHLKNKSYGIAQIRKSRLDDYFNQTGIRYYPKDMFDTVKSRSVFMFYAMRGKSEEEICRNWNGGLSGMKKKSTVKYWRKIQKAML